MPDRPGSTRLRWTEWTILALAALAAAWGIIVQVVFDPSQGVIHAATAPAFIVVVLTIVHMAARRSGILASSRYLALFSAVLATFIAISGFVLRERPAFAWGELVIGLLLLAACLYEAWGSDPSRRSRGVHPQVRARQG